MIKVWKFAHIWIKQFQTFWKQVFFRFARESKLQRFKKYIFIYRYASAPRLGVVGFVNKVYALSVSCGVFRIELLSHVFTELY